MTASIARVRSALSGAYVVAGNEQRISIHCVQFGVEYTIIQSHTGKTGYYINRNLDNEDSFIFRTTLDEAINVVVADTASLQPVTRVIRFR